MAIFTEIEQELLKCIVEDRLHTSLAEIRQATKKIWSTEIRIIQDYTDHGIEHSKRLANYVTELLKANDGRNLSEQEMYLLMAGIYLHDIGMQCNIVKFPEIKYQAEKLGAQFEVEFTAQTSSSYSIEEQKEIRKNHPYLTAAWIDYANRTGETVLGQAAKNIPEELVDDLMDVCKHHSKLPINDCPRTFKFDPTSRKQLIASLLRFSDELDVGGHRVIIETVKNFSLDPQNSIYWWLHSRTKVIFNARNMVLLTIRLHPKDAKQYGLLVHKAFITEFQTKNRSVLSVLAMDGIPIVIDDDSKVVEHDRAELLPPEIVQALHVMQEKRSPLLELANEVRTWLQTIRYEVNNLKQLDGRTVELVVTLEQGLVKQRVLVRCIGGEITLNDVDLLDKALNRKMPQGWLISDTRVSDDARRRATEDDAFQVFNLSEFLQQMVWGPYFEALKALVENNKIQDLYVDLACYKQTMDENGDVISQGKHGQLNEYIDEWLTERGKMHISLLGDFGSGKTWFCRQYAYRQLNRYLKDPVNERLPLLITLRSFANAMTIQQLINDALLEQYKLPFVGSAFDVFKEMNRRGKLLLILDGFDEMSRQVDYQTVVDNFWELAKLVDENSKVILTSRTEYFHWAKESETILGGEEFGRRTIALSPPKFEVIQIEPFSDDQIREVIILRLGGEVGPTVAKHILDTPNLAGMARKPVLVELLLAALDEVDSNILDNPAKVYLYATNKLLLRNIETERTFTRTEDKLFFLCELAWEMIESGELSIHYTEIPDRIETYFGTKIKDKNKLDNWDFDLRNQTLLHRNAAGYYEFAHKSLAEYFVAFKFAAELGCLAPVFLETYCEADGKSCKISIEQKNVIELAESFGAMPFKDERMMAISVLLKEMMCKDAIKRLWEVFYEIKGMTLKQIKYVGGNVATLLWLKGESFYRAKLANIVLSSAVLRGTNLIEADLKGAHLHNVDFTGSQIEGIDIRDADLDDVSIRDVFLDSIELISDERNIAVGLSNGTIIIKDLISEENISVLNIPPSWYMQNVHNISWSSTGLFLAATYWNGIVRVWRPFSKDLVTEINYSGDHVSGVAFNPDGNLLSISTSSGIFIYTADGKTLLQSIDFKGRWCAGCFSVDSKFFLCGTSDRTIKMWSLDTGLEVGPLWKGRAYKGVFWKVRCSEDGTFLAACGSNGFELWNMLSKKRVFGESKNKIYSVCFSRCNQYLAACDNLERIRIWKYINGNWIKKPICILAEHVGTVKGIVFSNDSRTLISCGNDSTIRIWDIDSDSPNFGQCLKEMIMKINCKGMQISGAHGLEQKIEGRQKGYNEVTLLEFLEERGALLDKEQKQILDDIQKRPEKNVIKGKTAKKSSGVEMCRHHK